MFGYIAVWVAGVIIGMVIMYGIFATDRKDSLEMCHDCEDLAESRQANAKLRREINELKLQILGMHRRISG